MTEQSEYLTRLVFENSSLLSLVNILYSPQNIKRAAAVSLSLNKSKTINFLNTEYIKNTTVQQNLIKYIYNTYQNSYGDLDNKIKLSNRLRYLRSFEYDDYIKTLTNKYYYPNNPGFQKTPGLFSVSPFPVVRRIDEEEENSEVSYKNSYIFTSLDNQEDYKSLVVYDLTSQTKVPTSRRVKIKKQDGEFIVGSAFDPFVYNNALTKTFGGSGKIYGTLDSNELDFFSRSKESQESFLDGTLSLDQAIESLSLEDQETRQELINKGLLSESEFVLSSSGKGSKSFKTVGDIIFVTSTSRIVFNQKKANDLLGLINGRVNEVNFALYLQNKVDNGLLSPIKGGLYILKKSAANEYALPVFNFNITPGRKEQLIFEQTAKQTFNYNNLYL